MRRYIFISIFESLFTLLSFSSVWPDGPANIYQVRIAKLELNNGTAWVTVYEGTSTAIDIASVGAGALAGNFMSGLSVPDGTYTQSRVTPSQTFKIKGDDGAGRYTTAAIGGNGGCVFTNVAAAEAACDITIATAITPTTTTFTGPITVTNGSASHKVRVSFNVSAAITYNAGANELFPAVPAVTVTTIAIQ